MSGDSNKNAGHAKRPHGAAPAVQLAPGGGAQRGMDERFQANGFTGTAGFHIPLPLTPARSFTPLLSLDYSSNAGQGIVGLGFSLSLSAISRRTSHGVPRYDDGDVFLLDDAVLVPDSAGAAPRTLAGAAYQVLRFRRRQEDHLLRIERWTPVADGGAAFWRLLEHDGTLRYFGLSAAARVSDPGDPSRVFAWQEELALDPKGEAQSYRYKQEDARQIAAAVCEEGRVHSAPRHPERICYGNRLPLALADGAPPDVQTVDWHYEIVFDYGEYDWNESNPDPYTPLRDWRARPDPYSTYNAGFERRTHRLCRNVAMFHRFASAWGAQPVLVQTTALRYDENPYGSSLLGVQSVGWRYRPGRPYRRKALPELTLAYTSYQPDSALTQPMRQISGELLAASASPPFPILADLLGEGVPGVLYADHAASRYWSPIAAEARAQAPVAYMPHPPEPAPQPPGAGMLADLDGDGALALVLHAGGVAGYHRMAADTASGWQGFTSFSRAPSGGQPVAAELADLSSSGREDLVLIDDAGLLYSASLGSQGFLPPQLLAKPDGLPPSQVETPTELTGFADLLGAGSLQRFRIRNGSVELWPSLGGGAFGQRVRLDGAPLFGAAWEPARLQLADLDGSGSTDLVYIHNDRVEIYASIGGNSYASDPLLVSLPAAIAGPEQISFANLYGNGACMIVRQDQPGCMQWVIDFCPAGKPYLLNTFADPMGSTTRVRYASASSFYLADKAAGRPWVTRLPFPLQVVERLEVEDAIAGARQVSAYTYHHGHYDMAEREFRGFGMVEHTDIALPRAGSGDDGAAIAAPTLTRHWFELGVWELEDALRAAHRREFFSLDGQAFPQPATRFVLSSGDAEAQRQARVAAAGASIREEVYALDGPSAACVPHTIVQSAATVTMLQAPAGDSSYGVYFIHERESVESDYDAVPDDPRILHTLTLALDDYGNVTRSCSVAYGRRPSAAQIEEQQQSWLLYEESDYLPARDSADDYLAGLPSGQRRYQIAPARLPAPGLLALYYDFDALARALPLPSAPLLSARRTIYLGEGGGATPSQPPAMQALVLREETAEFADADIRAVLGAVPLPGGLSWLLGTQGGYRLDAADGLWWAAGDTTRHGDASQFFRPLETRDVFATRADGRAGAITCYSYDPSWILATAVVHSGSNGDVQARQLTVEAIDYAGPEPRRINVNGRTSAAAFDPLGRLVAVSHYGSEWRDGAPAPAGFAPIGDSDWYDWPEPASLAALMDDPATYLRGAASYYYVDDEAFVQGRGAVGHARIQAADYPLPSQPAAPARDLRIDIDYRDAMGDTIQTMSLAEPGESGPRWRCSGSVRLNSKGLPFEAYRPHFSASWQYAAVDKPSAGMGLPHTFVHDVLDRQIRAARPLGALRDAVFRRSEFSPWAVSVFDENDTILDSPYYQQYKSGSLRLPPWAADALDKAAAFDHTPHTTLFDALDHPVRTLELLTPERALSTHRTFSILGRQLTVSDPRLARSGICNSQTVYTMEGSPLRTDNADAGRLYQLHDVNGALCFQYDARGTTLLPGFDSQHRSTALAVWQGPTATAPILVGRTIYGDSLDSKGNPPIDHALERNLFERPFLSYDGAGSTRNNAFSLQGQPLETGVQVRVRFGDTADWSATADSWPQLFAQLDSQMASDDLAGSGTPSPLLITRHTYNALGETLGTTDPQGNAQRIAYNAAGLPSGTWFAAAGQAERQLAGALSYDADGQQTAAVYQNADGKAFLSTAYVYDPDTLELTGIRATRLADGHDLQDLVYWHDPVGNITHVENRAPDVLPSPCPNSDLDYRYDALYRLNSSSGLALNDLTLADASSGRYAPFLKPEARASRYTLNYTFDDGGNLTNTQFSTDSTSWACALTVAPDSNRALPQLASAPPIHFDANGNQLHTADGTPLQWNWHNQILALGQREYYAYAGANYRRRRTIVAAQVVTDQFSFGGLHIDCTSSAGQRSVQFRRTRQEHGHHLLFERMTWQDGAHAALERYQLPDLLGSSLIEVDGAGRLLSYEQYAASGATVFAYGDAALLALKRFRYSAQQRDQDSGLYFYGARYLEPWSARWLSPDPAGDIDGPNRYAFVGGNPATFIDVGGLGKQPVKKKNTTPRKSANKHGARYRRKDVKGKGKDEGKLEVKVRRPGFNSAANKLKVRGTDLSHRTSWERLRDITLKFNNKEISGQKFKTIMKAIAPSLAAEIDAHVTNPTTDGANALLPKLNSALENLRAGHSGRNRSIKGRFDAGVRASSSRRRSRSPSPVSKRQIRAQLEHDEPVTFFTRGEHIQSSQPATSITVADMQSSLEDAMGSKLSVSRSGNEVSFRRR